MLEWSAKLGALEALEAGTTTIIDHNETPNAIEGSLSVIADACAEVGVRVIPAYGVSDRHGVDGAKRGLEENRRFLPKAGGAWSGSMPPSRAATRPWRLRQAWLKSSRLGYTSMFAKGPRTSRHRARLGHLTRPDWLLAHCVHLATDHHLAGTVVHNPASNLNNGVGYAAPSRFENPVALGTDGIGADMLESFRLAFYQHRANDLAAEPVTAWSWLETGWDLVPEARQDRVSWSYEPMDPWHLAYTTSIRPLEVEVGGEVLMRDGRSTRVEGAEIRAKAAEQAARLHRKL